MGVAMAGHGMYPPIQLDANMGLTAALQRMLVYSENDRIYLFHGMPERFTKGEAGPFLATGGIEVTMKWEFEENDIQVSILAKKADREVELCLPEWMSFSGEKAVLRKKESLKAKVNESVHLYLYISNLTIRQGE